MISINGIDFTKSVQEKSYKIDSHPIYSQWTDADGRAHRNVTRRRISGSFDLVFVEGMTRDYSDFLAAIEAAETDGELRITLSINNLDEVKEIICFYSIDFKPPRKISEERTLRKCTFKLEEC